MTTLSGMMPLYAPPIVCYTVTGDISKDNAFNAADLTVLRRYLLNGFPNAKFEKLSDPNGDGVADWTDYNTLRDYLNGSIQTFRNAGLLVAFYEFPWQVYTTTSTTETLPMQTVNGTPLATEVVENDRTTHTRTTPQP